VSSRVRRAGSLVSCAAFIGVLLPGLGSAAGVAQAPRGPALSASTGYATDAAYKPETVELSGDGAFTMIRAHWTTWNRRIAVAHGTAEANNCKPDCADGREYYVPLTLHESDPIRRCGITMFSVYKSTLSRKVTFRSRVTTIRYTRFFCHY
jgi:hypothetical protein